MHLTTVRHADGSRAAPDISADLDMMKSAEAELADNAADIAFNVSLSALTIVRQRQLYLSNRRDIRSKLVLDAQVIQVSVGPRQQPAAGRHVAHL